MPDDPNLPPLRQQQETRAREELAARVEAEQQTTREFQTPEEMLRIDAARTPLPDSLEPRLAESMKATPGPKRSWWRSWLGH
ncbi:MAG: hypothetical protein H7A46_18960 [Verrucomicrobiales bacterium]|nr:hypothetical protein [Verrucomicrobiales bacterium]